MSPTIDDIIASIEVELEAAQNRERKALKEVEVILAGANQEGRSNLTEEEDRRCEELKNVVQLAKSAQEGSKNKLRQALATKSELAEQEERFKSVTVTSAGKRTKPKYDEVMRVGSEPRVYSRESDPVGKQFLSDVVKSKLFSDVGSNERLARHMHEERIERPQYLERASDSTAQFTGLTVPQYLTDMVAPAVAAMKPFADLCTNQHQLPADGMSVNISKITTATTAGLQPTGENNALVSQAAQDTLLTIPVQTAGGWVNISRQAIDRGTGIDDVILQDLFKRYYTDLDNQLLNQATTGLANISTSTAAAGTTGPNIVSAIIGGMSRMESTLLGFGGPTHAVMHPRRWYYLQSQFGSTFPLINWAANQVPTNQAGIAFGNQYGSQVRGKLPNGLDVVADANVTTTGTDEIYVVSRDECHLWTDPAQPAFIRAEQPNATSLGVLLVVYGYYAYTFNRYTGAQQKITQAGFTAPTF